MFILYGQGHVSDVITLSKSSPHYPHVSNRLRGLITEERQEVRIRIRPDKKRRGQSDRGLRARKQQMEESVQGEKDKDFL